MTDRQAILFIAPRFPYPPTRGDKLVFLHRLVALSAIYTIDLLAFYENDGDPIDQEYLRKYCRNIILVRQNKLQVVVNVLMALLGDKPLQCDYYYNRSAIKKIRALLSSTSYTWVYLGTIRLDSYRDLFEKRTLVLDYIDSMRLNFERRITSRKLPNLLDLIEYRRLLKYERTLSKAIRVGFVVADADKHALDDAPNIIVVPNGVTIPDARVPDKVQNSIVYVGSMFYSPNIQAAHYLAGNILPRIRAEIPDVRLFIVGNRPVASIRRLHSDSIIVTGFVERVFDYIQASWISICPMLSGSGIQNKILECMAAGLPVITTTLGKGSIRCDDQTLLVRDRPDDVAALAIRLLRDSRLRDEIGCAARVFVEKEYSWATNYTAVRNALEKFREG